MNNKMFEAEIECGHCHSKKFSLRYILVDGIKSVIAHCECGRAVEYRGIEQSINLTGTK